MKSQKKKKKKPNNPKKCQTSGAIDNVKIKANRIQGNKSVPLASLMPCPMPPFPSDIPLSCQIPTETKTLCHDPNPWTMNLDA